MGNSLLEDLPGSDYNSCSFSSQSQNDMVPNTYQLEDIDSQSMGSSKHLKTHSSGPPLGWQKGGVNAASQFTSTEQSDWSPVKVSADKISSHPQHNHMDRLVAEETSVEESVLQELEMVMTQLTDKTRICFRDALYRLAKNSGLHKVILSGTADISMETPTCTDEDGKSRWKGNKAMELETNTVDRAIANLMFNKMDMNMQDFPISVQQVPSKELNQLMCHQTRV